MEGGEKEKKEKKKEGGKEIEKEEKEDKLFYPTPLIPTNYLLGVDCILLFF